LQGFYIQSKCILVSAVVHLLLEESFIYQQNECGKVLVFALCIFCLLMNWLGFISILLFFRPPRDTLSRKLLSSLATDRSCKHSQLHIRPTMLVSI